MKINSMSRKKAVRMHVYKSMVYFIMVGQGYDEMHV